MFVTTVPSVGMAHCMGIRTREEVSFRAYRRSFVVKRFFSSVFVIFLLLALGGCGSNSASSPTATAVPSPSPTLTMTPTPTPQPTETPPPTMTPTPAPLDPADIFDLVSPSVAFVETDTGTGSGILLADGYVVTNAHVVWPYREVRLVFPDGTEFEDVPVHNQDLMADLAVLGPIDVDLEPIELIDGEDNVVGSEVYLIGYPGEVERLPQPTITRGLISRMREWENLGISFFQTDALITGGQSGGVFVSEFGDVIGISGFSFTEAEFGLVASAVDIQARLDALIAGEGTDELGERPFPFDGGEIEYEVTLQAMWDQATYVINQPAGTSIEIEVEGDPDPYFGDPDPYFIVTDLHGGLVTAVDDRASGAESDIFTKEIDAPYLLTVGQFAESSGDLTITSNHPLAVYDDPDDYRIVDRGQTIAAGIDYPGDVDFYRIVLDAGEVVNIQVDTVLMDPVITVDYRGAAEEEIMKDDDSGAGLFGLNAELTYQAPHFGTYFIVVDDVAEVSVGGYQLTVGDRYEGAPTPMAPPPTPTALPPGQAAVYRSDDYPFILEVPSDYREMREECSVGLTTCYIGPDGGFVTIAEEELANLGIEINSLTEYTDLLVSIMESQTSAFELLSREQVETAAGPAEIISFTFQIGGTFLRGNRLVYVYEGEVAFNTTFLTEVSQYEEMEPLVSEVLSSLALAEGE